MQLIRKIIIGTNPKDAMAYYVGMKAGSGKVTDILADEAALYKYNISRYHVYVQDDKTTYIWKTVENLPVLIEYDCNFE